VKLNNILVARESNKNLNLTLDILNSNRKNHLRLIESFDGDAISIGSVDGDVGVAELTMAEQLADGVVIVEVFGVAKIGTLAAGDGAGSAFGRGLGIDGSRSSLGFGLTASSTAASTSDSNGGETDTHGSDESRKLEKKGD
jgi:hypothetical protein